MKARISKRVREEAVMLCAICASSMPQPVGCMEAQASIGASDDAYDLAYEAWCFVWQTFKWDVIEGSAQSGEADAEAECLLRCGWSPDDGGTP